MNEKSWPSSRTSPVIPKLTSPGRPRCVSVIVPCRNEAAHIDAFCDSALAQQLPEGWRLQVIVADGVSDDGTAEVLARRAALDDRLDAISNPGLIVSTGLNAALAHAEGEVIVRMDVHTQFAPDYVQACLAALERTGADNVGGPWVAHGIGPTGRAIAAAFQSRWIVGGALSRQVFYEGPVDTVYLGCWPRHVLAELGGFDETLVRNQDDEHNLRLRLAGRRIWQSATIHSSYRPRDSLRHLFRQQYQYGYWRPFVMKKHGQPGSLRQLVPATFVASLGIALLLSFRWSTPLLLLLSVYAAYLSAASLSVVCGDSRESMAQGLMSGKLALIGSTLVRLMLVVPTYHIAYGLGNWRGLLDLALGRRLSSDAARLSR